MQAGATGLEAGPQTGVLASLGAAVSIDRARLRPVIAVRATAGVIIPLITAIAAGYPAMGGTAASVDFPMITEVFQRPLLKDFRDHVGGAPGRLVRPAGRSALARSWVAIRAATSASSLANGADSTSAPTSEPLGPGTATATYATPSSLSSRFSA